MPLCYLNDGSPVWQENKVQVLSLVNKASPKWIGFSFIIPHHYRQVSKLEFKLFSLHKLPHMFTANISLPLNSWFLPVLELSSPILHLKNSY